MLHLSTFTYIILQSSNKAFVAKWGTRSFLFAQSPKLGLRGTVRKRWHNAAVGYWSEELSCPCVSSNWITSKLSKWMPWRHPCYQVHWTLGRLKMLQKIKSVWNELKKSNEKHNGISFNFTSFFWTSNGSIGGSSLYTIAVGWISFNTSYYHPTKRLMTSVQHRKILRAYDLTNGLVVNDMYKYAIRFSFNVLISVWLWIAIF